MQKPYLKPMIISAFFCVLAGLTLSFTSQVKAPGANPPPGSAGSASQPQNLSLSTPDKPPKADENLKSDTQQLLRFSDSAAREQFLEENNLSEADLIEIPKLQAFAVTTTKALQLNPGIQSFVNQRYRALLNPLDTLTAEQWHIATTNTPQAWNHQIGSTNVTVAVIDTGFGLQHQDLDAQWAINQGEDGSTAIEGPAPNCTSQSLPVNKRCNNYDDDSDGYVDNYLGWDFVWNSNNVSAGKDYPGLAAASHATSVASFVSAEANNNLAGTGVSWQSKILPVQVLDDSGEGYTTSVALGIRYAADHGSDIINLSLGADADDPLVSEQIDYAISQGVVVIAAAGNDSCDCILYPARYSSVVAVGATTSNNIRSSFSNYGASLDIVAPGSSLCASSWSQTNPTTRTSCTLSGTSFSSPIVAGAAALLLAQNPNLTPAEVTAAITGTSTKLASMNGANFTNQYGYGLLNTYAALNDVSITSSIGMPLSAQNFSLTELSESLIDYEYDKYNSTCSSSLAATSCNVRAIHAQTNQFITVSNGFVPGGTRSLQEDLLNANLSAGTWIIQTYLVSTAGVQSMARERIVTVVD